MATTKFIEYKLSSNSINCAHISNKIDLLLKDRDITAISTSPVLLESAGVAIGDKDIALSAILRCGTYIEVLMLECAMALENGAEEIEVLVDISNADEDETNEAMGELSLLKSEIEAEAIIKVDISFNNIITAAKTEQIIESVSTCGVDFIVLDLQNNDLVLLKSALEVIKNQSTTLNKDLGVKFKNVENQDEIIALVTEILGEKWINSDLFRIEKEF